MVVADADQVAELITPPLARDVSDIHAGDGAEHCWGTGKDGGRFVLVDCRSSTVSSRGVAARPPGVSSIGGRSGDQGGAGDGDDRARVIDLPTGGNGNRVEWRRLDPVAFLGRESEAAAQLLRGVGIGDGDDVAKVSHFAGAGDKREGRGGGKGGASMGDAKNTNGVVDDGVSNGFPATGSTTSNGDRRADTNDLRVGNGYNKSSVAYDTGCGGGDAAAAPFRACTTAAGMPITHVCFVGYGYRSGCNGTTNGGRERKLAADPAVRLARAAARAGLARVCVLDGGFALLEEALARKQSASASIGANDSTTAAMAAGSTPVYPTVVAAEDPVQQRSSTTATARDATGATEPMTVAGNGGGAASPGVAGSRESITIAGISTSTNTTKGPYFPAATPTSPGAPPTSHTAASVAAVLAMAATTTVSSRISVPTRATGASLPATPTSNARGVATGPAAMGSLGRTSSFSSNPERGRVGSGGGGSGGGERKQLGRVASNSRISASFRVYASKSADEMGRALKSLPAAAGKPLEVRIAFNLFLVLLLCSCLVALTSTTVVLCTICMCSGSKGSSKSPLLVFFALW